MAELDPQLTIMLEARTTKLEKDFARARKVSNDNMQGMERRNKQFADNTEKVFGKTFSGIGKKMESAFAPFLRGGVVFAGVVGAAMAIREIAGSIAEVDREARKAGVSAQVWQQWSYVATAAGASVDGITDALKELNIRGDEFAKTGKGSGAEWFERLGYSADEVGRKLQDPSRLMDELIGKIQRLDSSSQTRALDELFGGQGQEQLAKVLGLSVEQIQKLRSEAATFTDEQIAAAKKIDSEFATLWRNVSIYAKQAAIEGVGYAGAIIKALRGEWLPGYDQLENTQKRINSPEFKLEQAQKQRLRILKQLKAAEEQPDWAGKALEIRQLQASLQAVEDQIIALGGGSDKLKNALKELSDITQRAGGGFDGAATSAANFKTALADLKNLVPKLKAELDTLAQLDTIDAAFKKAVNGASTMSQIMGAVDVANRAKTIARYGKHDNILDLIASTESGGDYNAALDHGRWTGGAQNLTSMTLDQIQALQSRMRTPENRALYGDGKGSSALGRYQITGQTLKGLMSELGLTGDRLYDENTQDELARALLRRRGNDPTALRQEWAGLKNVDDTSITNAYGNTPVGAQKLAPTDGQQKQIDLTNQQNQARKSLNQTVQQGLDQARFEQSISGMSESQQRIELQLYQYQADAKRAGISLTDQEIQKMREKVTMTAQLGGENKKVATSAEGLRTAQQYFAQSFTSGISGLLTGTQTLNGALQNLLSSLIDATLQAALLGQGPLAGLFGGVGGGILGTIFGFSEGGYTGPGGKYQPKGVVHGGEYVMSKAATNRIGVGNLEALHRGALRGFADGGYVGRAPEVPRLLSAANGNAPQIAISAPITVNGSAGTPEQNNDLAEKMGRQMEARMRGVVSDELRKASRPGNMANNRGR